MIVCKTFSPSVPAVEKLGYILTVPTGFDPDKERLPLIISLHGAGSLGNDLELLKEHGIPQIFTADPDYLGLRTVTLSPQCPSGMIWNDIIPSVKELADFIVDRYGIDRTAVSVTGMSMGGYGTWAFGMRYPNFVSKLAPICGGGVSWNVGVLRNVKVRAFHGLNDSVVPVMNTVEMVEKLKSCGGTVEATYFPDTGHNSWDPAYSSPDLIPWLATK